MSRIFSIEARIADLEGPKPRMKCKDQIFAERCTTPELEELCRIGEKQESGEAWTAQELQFYEDLLLKYDWKNIPEEEPWDFEADRARLQRVWVEDHAAV